MTEKRRVVFVRVRCQRCGTSCGPLPLDGKPYICARCGDLLFKPLQRDQPREPTEEEKRETARLVLADPSANEEDRREASEYLGGVA